MKGTLLRDFGGRDRYMRFDANALATLGERLGIKIRLGHFQEDLMGTPLPLSAVRTLVWAGLLHEDAAVTEQQVGSWLDDENAAEVMAAFFSRFGGTSPQAQEALRSMMEAGSAEALPAEPTQAEVMAEELATGVPI